jgi:hypothetical protein
LFIIFPLLFYVVLLVTEEKSSSWAGKIVASYVTKRLSQDAIQVSWSWFREQVRSACHGSGCRSGQLIMVQDKSGQLIMVQDTGQVS